MPANYMQTAHAMCTALNVVHTSHSFGDVMLLSKASESKQVHHAYMTVAFLTTSFISFICSLSYGYMFLVLIYVLLSKSITGEAEIVLN